MGEPPRQVRAVLYDYRFSDWHTGRATGQWWERDWMGLYCPPVSLMSMPRTEPMSRTSNDGLAFVGWATTAGFRSTSLVHEALPKRRMNV